jgi:hypothetical protein
MKYKDQYDVAKAFDAIDTLRGDLVEKFGWTHISVDISTDRARKLIVSGCVAVPSILLKIRSLLREFVNRGWDVDYRNLQVLRTDTWKLLSSEITSLFRHPTLSESSLVTNLDRRDGPVEEIAKLHNVTLVRTMEGTIGWLEGIGPFCTAPRIVQIGNISSNIHVSVNSYLGLPYKLGGTTRKGIDCSGLVQRVYRDVFGIMLPRNSANQLRFAGYTSRQPTNSGDLVFTKTRSDGSYHVGIVQRWNKRKVSVIHASSTRGCVVEDSLDEFLMNALSQQYVPIETLISAHNRYAGKTSIEIPFRTAAWD